MNIFEIISRVAPQIEFSLNLIKNLNYTVNKGRHIGFLTKRLKIMSGRFGNASSTDIESSINLVSCDLLCALIIA